MAAGYLLPCLSTSFAFQQVELLTLLAAPCLFCIEPADYFFRIIMRSGREGHKVWITREWQICLQGAILQGYRHALGVDVRERWQP
jgi:hypothetical protein